MCGGFREMGREVGEERQPTPSMYENVMMKVTPLYAN